MAFRGAKHSRKKVSRAAQRSEKTRKFRIAVEVGRTDLYQPGSYWANACVMKKGRLVSDSSRCGYAFGRTPTAATKRALKSLTRNLK